MGAEKSKPAEKKVMDVSRPSQVAASPTSRPVIVGNRPLITQDPMVAGGDAAEASKTAAVKPATALTPHAEKVIKPLGEVTVDVKSEKSESEKGKDDEEASPFLVSAKKSTEEAASEEKATDEPVAKEAESATDTADAPEKSDQPESTGAAEGETSDDEAAASESDTTEEPKSTDEAEVDKPTDEITVDAPEDDKQASPEEAEVSQAEQKRVDELEEIIASGKYAVPINASGKRRTLIVTIWLVVLTLLLAVLLIDALLDVGVLTIQGVPHTHFFSLT